MSESNVLFFIHNSIANTFLKGCVDVFLIIFLFDNDKSVVLCLMLL